VVFTQGIPYNGNPNAVLPCLDICMYVTSWSPSQNVSHDHPTRPAAGVV
jgi:hypothetical protein